MSVQRKRIDFRFPLNIIDAMHKVCSIQQITRTAFVEQAIRDKLNSLEIKLVESKLVYGKDWEL